MLNFNMALSSITAFDYNINNFKKRALDVGKMPEYDLCNQIRINFYRFRNKILDEIIKMADDMSYDFSFIDEHISNIEVQCNQLIGLEEKEIVEIAKFFLNNAKGSIELYISEAKIFTKKEKAEMLSRVIAYQCSRME